VKLNYILFGIRFLLSLSPNISKTWALSLRNVGKLNFDEIVGLPKGNALSPIFMHTY